MLGREGDAGLWLQLPHAGGVRLRGTLGRALRRGNVDKAHGLGSELEDWPRSELGGGRVSTGVGNTVGWAEELCYGGLGPAWLSHQPCAGAPEEGPWGSTEQVTGTVACW